MKEATFNQILHGYRDGHRLLAASCPISKESERIMLALSDLSGHSVKKGFEEYITGYALKSDNTYVFAKTWYADEMPRPGCVWTHSILIDFSTLATIDNLEMLIALFDKPTKSLDFDRYKSPLRLDTEQVNTLLPNKEAENVLSVLYDNPNSPIIIATSEIQNYQSIIVKLWSQQWPKLRRSFSFCSGSIVPRTLDEELLDIQITHPSALTEVKSRYANAIILQESNYEAIAEENWLEWTTKDLTCLSEKTKLRKFLYEFGGEFENGRAVFKKLVRIFIALETSQHHNISFIYEEIARLFPKKDEAKILKKALVEQSSRAKEWLGENWNIAEIADFILFSQQAKAFRFNKEMLEKIILQSWKSEPEQFVEGLQALEKGSDIWSLAEKTIIPTVTIDELPYCRNLGKQFFTEVLIHSPELLLHDKSWRYENEFSELYADISRNYINNHPDRFLDILYLAFKAVSERSLENFYRIDNKKFIEALLNYMVSADRSFEAFDYNKFLKKDVRLTLELTSKKHISDADTLACIYHLISPLDTKLLGLFPEIWLPLIQSKEHEGSKSVILKKSSVPLLLIGLQTPSDTGLRLVDATFTKVHKQLLENNLKREAKDLLSDYVEPPTLSFLFWLTEKTSSETIAESLRRTLVTRFLEHNWNASTFKKLVNSKNNKKFFEKTLFLDKQAQSFVEKALS